MKHLFPVILSLFLFSLANAQVSNARINFSCPTGKVTVTYNLNTNCTVDATLYYSHNKRDWLIAQTITGDITAQTTGTGKTIVWDCFADNVRLGGFYFKVETSQCEEPECVWINGVCWATRNVGAPGTFVENPEDAGMFYQWNRNIGWNATDPMINSNGGTTWNSSDPTGTAWTKANDPSPAGWRVPTLAEIQSLLNTTYVTRTWTTQNSVNGLKLTDIATSNTLFLPAAGYRWHEDGTLYSAGSSGFYWSSTRYDFISWAAYSLQFWSSLTNWVDYARGRGSNVRCVAE